MFYRKNNNNRKMPHTCFLKQVVQLCLTSEQSFYQKMVGAISWNRLGSSLGIKETAHSLLWRRTRSYTNQQCYVEELTLDPNNVNAWTNLGADLGIEETLSQTAQIGTRSYTSQQCYIQALTLDPKFVNAWILLGFSLGVGETAQVGRQRYTSQQCYAQALTLDPTSFQTWYNVGHSFGNSFGKTVLIGSKSYTKAQCYIQALASDPSGGLWTAWFDVGISLRGETAMVGRQRYTMQQCYKRGFKELIYVIARALEDGCAAIYNFCRFRFFIVVFFLSFSFVLVYFFPVT